MMWNNNLCPRVFLAQEMWHVAAAYRRSQLREVSVIMMRGWRLCVIPRVLDRFLYDSSALRSHIRAQHQRLHFTLSAA